MGAVTLLDADVQSKIVESLRAGSPIRDACEWAGIDYDAYHSWQQRGKTYEKSLSEGGEIIDGEDVFRQFWLETMSAKAFARVRAIGVVARAMPIDWKAAAWYLERVDPENWRPVNRTEVSGPDGGGFQVPNI